MMQTHTIYSLLKILQTRISDKNLENNATSLWLEMAKMREENYENWRDNYNLGRHDDAEIAWQTRELCADIQAVLGIVAFKK